MNSNTAKKINDELTIRQRMKLTRHNVIYVGSSIAVYLFVMLCLIIVMES